MKKVIAILTCLIILCGCSNTSSTESSVTSKIVQNEDLVLIDFEGKIDGQVFEGGTAKNQIALIGSGMYIPGFEEGMIGMKKDETRDVKATFPENYGHAEMAGKEATFTITVHHIYREVK